MAEDVRIKLQLETNEARRQLDRFRDDLGGAADDSEAAAKQARQQLQDQARATVGAVAGGAVGALGAPGAGGADAFFGGIRSLQAALPALGGAFGFAQGGPLGGALGVAGGEAAAAGLRRQFGPREQAREMAISETQQLFAARAARGVEVSEEALERVFEAAMTRAMRVVALEGRARSAAGAQATFNPVFPE